MKYSLAYIGAAALMALGAQDSSSQTNSGWVLPLPAQTAVAPQLSPSDLATLTNALGPLPPDSSLSVLSGDIASPLIADGPGWFRPIQTSARLINVNLGGT